MADYDLDKYLDDVPKTDREKVQDGDIEDPRTNFSIAKCCKNCRNFWYDSAARSKGYCKLPNPLEKQPFKQGGEKYDKVEIERGWLRVHMTTVCDNHVFKPHYTSIESVAKWTHRAFNDDGTPYE